MGVSFSCKLMHIQTMEAARVDDTLSVARAAHTRHRHRWGDSAVASVIVEH